MILDRRPVDRAEGAVLAHAVSWRADERARRMAKGTRLDARAIDRLRRAGIARVEVAVPEPGDVAEDEAARRCADALLKAAGSSDDAGERGARADTASTGRVNLRSATAGLFRADRAAVDALNAIDARLTIATLPDGERVGAGELVATIKVIPFFVPGERIERWAARCGGGPLAVDVVPWRGMRVAHLSTVLEGTKPGVLEKTRRALLDRLRDTGATALPERRLPHERADLAEALIGTLAEQGPDIAVVFGASAVTDEGDIVPDAIRAAGGTIERVGMPVDPGNLLVLGRVGATTIIGAPGCARSPARNGFDWVLDRSLAGLSVRDEEIAAWGVGGLLKEIPARPSPRETAARARGEPRADRADASRDGAGRAGTGRAGADSADAGRTGE